SKNGLEDYAGAVPYYERAVAILERQPDHAYLGLALAGLADCLEEVGDFKRAVSDGERALELVGKGKDVVQLAYAQFVLAKALWSANEQHARARALATEAQKGFAKGGLTAFNGLAAVQQWFAKIDGSKGQPR